MRQLAPDSAQRGGIMLEGREVVDRAAAELGAPGPRVETGRALSDPAGRLPLPLVQQPQQLVVLNALALGLPARRVERTGRARIDDMRVPRRQIRRGRAERVIRPEVQAPVEIAD